MTCGIVLINPRYPHNVGGILRGASCYGADFLYWTGRRVTLEVGQGERLPREERMRGYRDVEFMPVPEAGLFNRWEGLTPVAVEVNAQAEQLPEFVHPENAVYLFGPEDSGLGKVHRMHCHRHVVIPTRHCLNLSAAVHTVLYDRMFKRRELGLEPTLPSWEILDEDRGYGALGLGEGERR